MVWLVRSAGAVAVRHLPRHQPPRRSPGLQVLEERYARSEIDRDEDLQKTKDMSD